MTTKKNDKRELLDELEAFDQEIQRTRRARPNPNAVLELQNSILKGRREAFAEELAEVLAHKPSEEAMVELAEKPLERAQVAKIWGGLAGIAERHEVDVTKEMSEVEMRDFLERSGYVLPDTKFPHEIDATANEVSNAENGPDTANDPGDS